MKERPVLFSGPMVRALLAGTKTQTRRVFKVPAGLAWYHSGGLRGEETGDLHDLNGPGWCSIDELSCPYGQPGDRLWVREAFAFTDAHEPDYEGTIEYRADNKCLAVDAGRELIDVPHGCDPRPFAGPWTPSIHMPRWTSRITLEITSVRVERLTSISEVDAAAEGMQYSTDHIGPWSGTGERWWDSARWAFKDLWLSINGGDSWDANRWVWVVEFKRVEQQR